MLDPLTGALVGAIGKESVIPGVTQGAGGNVLGKLGDTMSGASGKGLGTAAGAAFGLGQFISSKIAEKKAKGLEPALEDPEMRQNLSRIQREAQALRTGTAFSRERQELAQLGSQVGTNAARLSGGAVGAAVSGQTKASKMVADALVKLSAKGKQLASEKDNLITQQIENIAQRKLELKLAQQERQFAKAAALGKASRSNLAAIIASAGGAAVDPIEQMNTAGTEGAATSAAQKGTSTK